MDAAPPTVDQALARPGRPLDSALRRDMEQRFGYDFSQVRVHSDAAAEQSARDVAANAYTVGHSMVFGEGRFSPGTHEGRRLIAHELTHVVQQSGADGIRAGQNNGVGGLFVSSDVAQVTGSGRRQFTVNGTTSAYLARQPTAAGGVAVAQSRAKAIQRIFRPDLSLDEVMALIESIRPSEYASGLYTLVGDGEVFTFTQDEYNKIRASAQKTLLDGIRRARSKAEDAEDQYNAQHTIDRDQWFVSHAVRFFGGIEDPGESVRQNVRFARANANAAQVFAERGQLVRGAMFFAQSAKFATIAKQTSQTYVDQVISTAETTVTVLEVTAVAAAVTVVVIGVVVAAPVVAAAARAAPVVVGLMGAPAVETAAITAPVVETAVVAAPTAAVVAPTAAVAAPTVAVAAPTTVAIATPTTVAVAAPAATSTLSSTALATAGLATLTLSGDTPKPEEETRRRRGGAYPLCWALQLGPPMLFGTPVTTFIRTPGVERDTEDADQRRLELLYRQRVDPSFRARDFHVHHSVPLFLGGLDAAPGNLVILPGRLHLRGHGVLRYQPQMLTPPTRLAPLPADILAHPPGTRYQLVGFKGEANETC